jgi:hypothetical protein
MAAPPLTPYKPASTAILLVDPYNDFIHENGKFWPLAKRVAEEVHLLDHLRAILAAARKAGIRIFFVPHHRWEPGDYEHWKFPTQTQAAAAKRQPFAKGSWGGSFHDDFQMQPGDILIKEHWGQSGSGAIGIAGAGSFRTIRCCSSKRAITGRRDREAFPTRMPCRGFRFGSDRTGNGPIWFFGKSKPVSSKAWKEAIVLHGLSTLFVTLAVRCGLTTNPNLYWRAWSASWAVVLEQ